MTQNGLKHILNMFLKSVTKTILDPPTNVKNVTLFFNEVKVILKNPKHELTPKNEVTMNIHVMGRTLI